MSSSVIYSFYYKDSLLLRSYRDPKTYVRSFEFLHPSKRVWQPIPNNQILSMNMAKYKINKLEAENYLKDNCSAMFQKTVKKR